MKNQTKQPEVTNATTTTKETVTKKLRDLSLEDLDIVTGGMAACDNNIGGGGLDM